MEPAYSAVGLDRLRLEAERSRKEAYKIIESSIKKVEEALEEARKTLMQESKPSIHLVKDSVQLPPMESKIVRYLEERRGLYIKPHILAKRIKTKASSERFREALERLKSTGIVREDRRGVTIV